MAQSMSELRERRQDPLLTALTILLAVLIFVLAPLRAERVPGVQEAGFALVTVLAGAVLILSGRRIALWALLIAILLAAIASIHRARPSSDISRARGQPKQLTWLSKS